MVERVTDSFRLVFPAREPLCDTLQFPNLADVVTVEALTFGTAAHVRACPALEVAADQAASLAHLNWHNDRLSVISTSGITTGMRKLLLIHVTAPIATCDSVTAVTGDWSEAELSRTVAQRATSLNSRASYLVRTLSRTALHACMCTQYSVCVS
eukprot:1186835-Prorocentrum_minimum.AAC.6